MVAHTEKGYFYIKGDKRFKFISDRARISWNLHEVDTTESAMSNVKLAGIVGFRDGSLIRDVSNNKLYLVVDNKKMLVVDPDDLFSLGFKKHDAILVSKREADFQKDGGNLNGR
jgi:hypothetical protein